MWVQTIQLTWILILTTQSATVDESSRTYHCCKNGTTLEEEVHPHCEQSWTEGDMSFAEYKNDTSGCLEPCMGISSGKIKLSKCANVTLSLVCFNGESNSLQEHWIQFTAVKDKICLQQHIPPLTAARPRNQYVRYGILGGVSFVLLGFMLLLFCRRRPPEPQSECGV